MMCSRCQDLETGRSNSQVLLSDAQNKRAQLASLVVAPENVTLQTVVTNRLTQLDNEITMHQNDVAFFDSQQNACTECNAGTFSSEHLVVLGQCTADSQVKGLFRNVLARINDITVTNSAFLFVTGLPSDAVLSTELLNVYVSSLQQSYLQ